VEYVAKYGNVLQSPAVNLYWWQQRLLDVYAFILAIIITIFYLVLFIFRKLKKHLFGLRACAKKDNAAMKSKKNKWSWKFAMFVHICISKYIYYNFVL